METDKNHFLLNENIVVSYAVSSKETITSFDYAQNGFTVINARMEKNNHILLELSCLPNESDYSFIMQILMSNGENVVATLYAIRNDYGYFISPFSKDDALQKYFDYAKMSKLMTQDEYEIIKSELSKIGVIENETIERPYPFTTNLTRSSTETNVNGTLQWTDDAGNNHPLRRVMIRIYDDEPIGSTLLATTYADNNGYFSYTFDNPDGFWDFENGGNDIFIRVYAGTNNAMVKNSSGDEYYYESPVSENVTTGTTVTKDVTIGMSTDLGKAFQISQAILTARDFAWNMIGTMPENVVIRYPYDSGCYYTRSEKRINVTGNPPSGSTYPNSYASWDVLMHEYGHHIQYQIDITDNPGGSHSSFQNDADIRKSKDIGIRLAWGESWPTVFGTIAQRYFGGYLSNIATVGDTYYTAYNGLNYDIETSTICLGEASEQSIMAVLLDLFDSENDSNDTISLGYTNYWNVTTSNHAKTFSDFITNFYNIYPYYIDDIGPNLTYYKMATTKPSMSNASSVSQTVPPRFSWAAQGGSSRYPNNSFALVFYNSSGTEVLRTATTTSTNYTLTQSEWNSVLYSYGKTYTVSIAATQTDYPTTGEYISSRSVLYTKPMPETLTQSFSVSAINRYTEKIVTLQPRQYIDYTVTFETGGPKLIQTFGPKDAELYLYDSDYNLLSEDDDDGYSLNALISTSVTANTPYIIRVKFHSDNNSGEIKLSIVPTYHHDNFESAYGPYKITTVNWSLSTDRVALFRYRFDNSENITFTMSSSTNTDTYLYLIDPESTSAITRYNGSNYSADNLYDDDSGGSLQAQLTKSVQANKVYLAIISFYNPHTMSGSFSINTSN